MTDELRKELYTKVKELRDLKAEFKEQRKLDNLAVKNLEAEIEEIVGNIENNLGEE